MAKKKYVLPLLDDPCCKCGHTGMCLKAASAGTWGTCPKCGSKRFHPGTKATIELRSCEPVQIEVPAEEEHDGDPAEEPVEAGEPEHAEDLEEPVEPAAEVGAGDLAEPVEADGEELSVEQTDAEIAEQARASLQAADAELSADVELDRLRGEDPQFAGILDRAREDADGADGPE